MTAAARLKKHQDFSKTWGRSIYGSLGRVFARVTGAQAADRREEGTQNLTSKAVNVWVKERTLQSTLGGTQRCEGDVARIKQDGFNTNGKP